ncbi:MAG: hypothetical protein WDW38_010442 [Sanguina aurantia]
MSTQHITSAPAHAGANSDSAQVQRRRSKLTPAQQQHLTDHPPGSERWRRGWQHGWRISQLLTAASIRYDPDAADSKPGPALGDAELAALLRAHPSVLSVSVQQAADVLAWLGSTLDHGMVKLDVSKTVLYAPELLSYSVARLQAQLQGLLGVEGLEQSREELCDRLIHNPRLLTIKTSTLVARLDRLHTEFRCSRKHVLMTASYVLERGPDRLLIRGAFMQGMIGSGAVTLSEVWATSSDARFADFKVRGHLQETSQSLAQFCADVKGLAGDGGGAGCSGAAR